MILDKLDTSGRPEKIDRAALLKSDCRTLQPLFGFCLRSEDIRCLCEDLGEFPRAAALFLAERLGGVSFRRCQVRKLMPTAFSRDSFLPRTTRVPTR
ncbi:hypothetical protein ACQY74_001079 (plasmid) [Rhizobium leguminosarum bv. trifolii]